MANARILGIVRRAVAAMLIGGTMVTLAVVSSEPVVAVTADRYSHDPADRRGYGVGERGTSSNHGAYRGRNENPCRYTPEGVCTGGR